MAFASSQRASPLPRRPPLCLGRPGPQSPTRRAGGKAQEPGRRRMGSPPKGGRLGWGWHPARKVLVDPPSVLGVQGGARRFRFWLPGAHVACVCWSPPRTSSVWPVGPVHVSGRPSSPGLARSLVPARRIAVGDDTSPRAAGPSETSAPPSPVGAAGVGVCCCVESPQEHLRGSCRAFRGPWGTGRRGRGGASFRLFILGSAAGRLGGFLQILYAVIKSGLLHFILPQFAHL